MKAIIRITFWSAMAMAISMAAGSLAGQVMA
jgi:hypothetical protein